MMTTQLEMKMKEASSSSSSVVVVVTVRNEVPVDAVVKSKGSPKKLTRNEKVSE
jgi:hypothetical protein